MSITIDVKYEVRGLAALDWLARGSTSVGMPQENFKNLPSQV